MMKIEDFEIGTRTFIIAEIGNNHLGDPALAYRSVEAAAQSGVDAVKFQLFNPDLLVSTDEPVLKHVPENKHSTQRERFKSMVLSSEIFEDLARKARALGLIFLCTPFDIESVDFLDQLVPAFKIASGDADNVPLIKHVISKGKPVMISTGMCNQEEVDYLVSLLPEERSILLHCIGSYPAPDEQVCLSLIPFYKERYKIPVGYSDHTIDTLVPLAAVAMGAVVIEKHFILNRSIPGGDRNLSLAPDEMGNLVKDIRRVETIQGTPLRTVQGCEMYGRHTLRRNAYTRRTFLAGERLTIQDVIWLRPATDKGVTFKDFDGSGTFIVQDKIFSEQPLTTENVKKLED